MRGRLFGASVVTLLLVLASCGFPSSRGATCADDIELCPQSSKSATSVTCDCRCTVGLSEETGQVFEGHIPVCLPPDLNRALAPKESVAALSAVEPRVFDQRVFQFCSKDVAGFLRSAIRMPGHLVLACASPVRCDCGTSGTTADTAVCRSPCDEIACDARNCPNVLRKDSTVDVATCFCSRASSCGSVSPETGAPGLCRDWTHQRPTKASMEQSATKK